MKKLIAIDLDGTTLNQDSIITDKTAKTLRRALILTALLFIFLGRNGQMNRKLLLIGRLFSM